MQQHLGTGGGTIYIYTLNTGMICNQGPFWWTSCRWIRVNNHFQVPRPPPPQPIDLGFWASLCVSIYIYTPTCIHMQVKGLVPSMQRLRSAADALERNSLAPFGPSSQPISLFRVPRNCLGQNTTFQLCFHEHGGNAPVSLGMVHFGFCEMNSIIDLQSVARDSEAGRVLPTCFLSGVLWASLEKAAKP